MKDRAFWSFVVVAALVLAGAYWLRNRTPPVTPSSTALTAPAPKVAAPVASTSAPVAVASSSTAAPAVATPRAVAAAVAAVAPAEKKPRPEVTIQEGKTIDFSSGVAVVKDDAKQKATIDKAVADMESALQSVTFAAPAQKAEPTPAPSKP
jgi:hypothetical protein